MDNTFTIVNDDVVESYIKKANRKIVYVAPGISNGVVTALEQRLPDLGKLAITLIVDNDPEVYRMGYGDVEALQRIKTLADKHMLEIRQQSGVRIGLLIADDNTLIYSPTPKLIEAGSISPEKPNAIMLDSTPSTIDKACATGKDSLLSDSEIGTNLISSNQLEEIKEDLVKNPPRPFNIARIERVFTSRIQYVEFKVEKYRLSTNSAPIPPDLLGLTNDPTLQKRWHNTFHVFDRTNKIQVSVPSRNETGDIIKDEFGDVKTFLYGEGELEAERRKIEKDYLYKVQGFGSVIFRQRRKEFDSVIEKFMQRLDDYEEAVSEEVEKTIDKTIRSLTEVLFPLVKKDPPPRYLKSLMTSEISDDQLLRELEKDLRREFGKKGKIGSPQVKIQYKDISYETIHDPDFKIALSKVIDDEDKIEKLFSEHDAAPEQ